MGLLHKYLNYANFIYCGVHYYVTEGDDVFLIGIEVRCASRAVHHKEACDIEIIDEFICLFFYLCLLMSITNYFFSIIYNKIYFYFK